MIKFLPSFKKDKKNVGEVESIKERYGVMDEIPEQELEEESLETEEKPKEEGKSSKLDLLLRMEKIEAKLGTIDDFKDDVDERLMRLAEEVGELRSSLLEIDKNFSSLQADTERVLEATHEIHPEKIKEEMEKKSEEMLKLEAEIETLKAMLDTLKKDNKRVMEFLEQVKNLENMVEMSKRIDAKLKAIERTKAHVDRMAAKSELIFTELSERVKELEQHKEKIRKLDELTADMVKMLDGISLKIPKFVEKENVERILAEKVREELRSSENVKKAVNELKETIKKDVKLMVSQDLKRVDERLEENKRQLMKLIDEKLGKVRVGDKSNFIQELHGLKTLLEELTRTLSKERYSITNINERLNLYFNFIQSVNTLPYLSRMDEISMYLSYVRSLVERMKALGLWNKSARNFLLMVLTWLVETWDSYGHGEIKRMYERELQTLQAQ